MAKHYCNSAELEEWWSGWNETNDSRNWTKMTEMLYDICLGIAKKFKPSDDDEYHNLANEAMLKLMHKITTGKLKFKPTCKGGSPVFNLVTTTVQRILYSYKNAVKNKKIRHSKHVIKVIQENAPELMSSATILYDF